MLMVAYSPDERDDGNPQGCITMSWRHAAEGEAPVIPTLLQTPWPSLV